MPWALTVDGGVLGGLLGPVFLLAPVALLAARSALGRRALLAAVLFGLPWAANVGTRVLIPALPFAGLALALALPGRVLPALVVLHALALAGGQPVCRRARVAHQGTVPAGGVAAGGSEGVHGARMAALPAGGADRERDR